MIRALFRLLAPCRHKTLYRERRPLYTIDVMHWVCRRCGRAWPVMRRTPDEYRVIAENEATLAERRHRVIKGRLPIFMVGGRRVGR
jgi:hypothetical protein